MPDKDASTPRVFLIRHGQTEWSMSGQYTSQTDIPLTAHGEEQVTSTAKFMYGPGKLIDPAKVAKAWVSPRKRAVKTYELLSGANKDYEVTENLAEWHYGCVVLTRIYIGNLADMTKAIRGYEDQGDPAAA